MIDIVVATCERLPLLERTLASIWANTRTPYRLTVIDDASAGGNGAYLEEQCRRGRVAHIMLRLHRAGIAANLRALYGMTSSELIIYCDDDQLCPQLEPDWLSRLLAEMRARPRLALLSLNNPHGNVGGDKRHRRGGDGAVTYCEKSGGSFMVMRRWLLPQIVPPDGTQSPVSALCLAARRLGWENGYLTDIYCQHIGEISMRNGWDLRGEMRAVAPVDGATLTPPEAYRQ